MYIDILPSSSEANSNKAACGWSMEKSKQIASKSTVSFASTVFFHFQKSYGDTLSIIIRYPSCLPWDTFEFSSNCTLSFFWAFWAHTLRKSFKRRVHSSTLVATRRQVAAISYRNKDTQCIPNQLQSILLATYINWKTFHRVSHVETVEESTSCGNNQLWPIVTRKVPIHKQETRAIVWIRTYKLSFAATASI